MPHPDAFDAAGVLADAQRKEALTDWGPGDFARPPGVLLADYAHAVSRADLNSVGAHILRSGIVRMHRDPRATIASGAGLNATLHAMHADSVDLHRVGAQWLQRMGWTNDRAMAVRDGWTDDAARVTDIAFDDAVADPIGQVARVYNAIGLPLTAEAETATSGFAIGE
ncbi:sulfotransferase [Mycobacterium sp. THU-M104]|uniref:sulfotransferase n=1 Tax=Mycobacterium sp. THU-M104 TaxID=3410515 RepID=UPI003B99DC79